jgi:hypothetical protein
VSIGGSAGTVSGASRGTTSGSTSGAVSGCNLTASASVAGTLLGKSLAVKDALTIQTNTSGMYMTSVAIVDYPDACLLNPVQSVKASSKILIFRFSVSGPLGTGVFTIPSTLDAQYASYDAACTPTGESPTGGSVHVTQANACGATGTFDLVLNSDHVTGSFVAPTCNPVSTDGGECL